MYAEHVDLIPGIVAQAAVGCFEKVNGLFPKEEQRLGGYVCVALNKPDAPPLLIVKIGEQPEAKAVRSFRLCQKKIWYLQHNTHHMSSWQGRNEKHEIYGGGFRYEDLLIAGSGHTEHGDELWGFEILLDQEWWIIPDFTVDPQRLEEISGLSNNPLFSRRDL